MEMTAYALEAEGFQYWSCQVKTKLGINLFTAEFCCNLVMESKANLTVGRPPQARQPCTLETFRRVAYLFLYCVHISKICGC